MWFMSVVAGNDISRHRDVVVAQKPYGPRPRPEQSKLLPSFSIYVPRPQFLFLF